MQGVRIIIRPPLSIAIIVTLEGYLHLVLINAIALSGLRLGIAVEGEGDFVCTAFSILIGEVTFAQAKMVAEVLPEFGALDSGEYLLFPLPLVGKGGVDCGGFLTLSGGFQHDVLHLGIWGLVSRGVFILVVIAHHFFRGEIPRRSPGIKAGQVVFHLGNGIGVDVAVGGVDLLRAKVAHAGNIAALLLLIGQPIPSRLNIAGAPCNGTHDFRIRRAPIIFHIGPAELEGDRRKT